ncbi:hypothetical protein [Methylosinus sp. PW1]|uniref:hypothetical protein n=1 Tax=Methylosinus sp. PW1 TaxID=107636 RepID=UPI000567D8C5|nr:hypothetical protein [Methylosinus sp. PW1]
MTEDATHTTRPPRSADDAILDDMLGIRPPLPPAEAGNRLKRADPKKQLAPERLKELSAQHRLMIRYMVHGISSPVIARQHRVGVDVPLSFRDAALVARIRVHRARTLISDPLFRGALAEELRNFRASIAPEAIRVVAAIVEDPGDNTAADRTVRLKAAAAILGDAVGPAPAQTSINVSVTNKLTAGVVVRIPQAAPEAAPATIDAQPSRLPVRMPRATVEADPEYRDRRAKRFDMERAPPPVSDEN